MGEWALFMRGDRMTRDENETDWKKHSENLQLKLWRLENKYNSIFLAWLLYVMPIVFVIGVYLGRMWK